MTRVIADLKEILERAYEGSGVELTFDGVPAHLTHYTTVSVDGPNEAIGIRIVLQLEREDGQRDEEECS